MKHFIEMLLIIGILSLAEMQDLNAGQETYLGGTSLGSTTQALTYYVDYANGTDDSAHGLASGSDAFKTWNYAIGRLPKYLAHTVIIQGADEDVAITTPILIYGFQGYGSLSLKGNAYGSRPAAGHYELDGASVATSIFDIGGNSAYIYIQGFYLNKADTTQRGFQITYGNSCVDIFYCVTKKFDKGACAYFGTNSHFSYCNFDDCNEGIYAAEGRVWSRQNLSSTNCNYYGLKADGGFISKYDATQPGGDTGAENEIHGGDIW